MSKKSAILGFLKEEVINKFRSWATKNCFEGGPGNQEILNKPVAQTLSSYAMSALFLPLEVTRDIKNTGMRTLFIVL